MVRRRNAKMTSPDQTSLHTLVDDPLPAGSPPAAPDKASSARRWMLLAVASGGCAAFNGMFAKLYDHLLFPVPGALPCAAYFVSTGENISDGWS